MAKKPKTAAPATVLDTLRDVLRRWEQPAGPDGFEGLIAQALATVSGYTFRLARSGAQFGRDAATPNAPFAIAMEAKRYTKSVPLEALAGKSSLAAFALADKVDLWVLAATVETSEPTEKMLEEILESAGVSLLNLDWAETGLPPLAVLLAAASAELLPWAQARLAPLDFAGFEKGLEFVAKHANFAVAEKQLLDALTSGSLGLDALRERNTAWIELRFADQQLAQQHFSQYLAPLDSTARSISRPVIQAELGRAFSVARADPEGRTLVAVLGGEGSGKSWAVAQWWVAQDPRPILLLSAGRIAEQLSPDDEPFDMLARLAALQDGHRDSNAIARWRRRLERWAAGNANNHKFVVFLDGLNETSGKAWASIIRVLLPVVRDLGGAIVATCREGYWDREIASRLSYVAVEKVSVGDYSDDEFSEVLALNAIPVSQIPDHLNGFMRTPRICALAITLLPTLQGIEDLSVERLLMEYWRARLRERGDLVGHGDDDFRELLIRHANAYRARPGTNFNRDEWRKRSGAAQRLDGRRLSDDLTDIEEGRFFDSKQNKYAFRPEALHFALGLLVADELNDAQGDGFELGEALEGIIDAVRGFDMLADILTAAIAIGSLDEDYPDACLAALVAGWMSLQNLTDNIYERLLPYTAAHPGPFLDAFEFRDLETDDGRFGSFLLFAQQRDEVATAIGERADRWLGSWCRSASNSGPSEERERRQRERDELIDTRLGELQHNERKWFDTNCPELPRAVGLGVVAAQHMAGRAQSTFARGIIAFSFAHRLAGDHRSPLDELAWAIRLNRIDFEATSAAVHREIEPFVVAEASPLAHAVAATALSFLGALADQQESERLKPMPVRRSRPDALEALDPTIILPEPTGGFQFAIDQIDPAAIWNHMSTTSEDYDLERSTSTLLRVDPARLTRFLDRVAATVTVRNDMPLRQLGWHLPWLSPLLSNETVTLVQGRLADLSNDPTLVPAGDAEFVLGMMVEGIMPRLEAGDQLDLLLSLPEDAPYYLRYNALARQFDPTDAAERLSTASSIGGHVLERTLLFLAAAPPAITDVLRDKIVACLADEHLGVAAAVAELVRKIDDAEIDDALLGLGSPDDSDRSWTANARRLAFAVAVARRNRDDLIDQVALEFLDWVAVHLPAARARLVCAVDMTIERLLQPVDASEPNDAMITLELGDSLGDTRINIKDRGENRSRPPEEALEALNADLADETGARFAERRRLLHEQFDRFLDNLEHEGARMLTVRPQTFGLKELAIENPVRHKGWIDQILAIEDEATLRKLQSFALVLAESYAVIDSTVASSLFAHVWKVDPIVTIVVGRAKLPLRTIALFRAARSEEIDNLRGLAFEQCKDDEAIERLVLAAEACNSRDWLDTFIARCAASLLAADQALAITSASFRTANPQSDEILARDWGDGFLGSASKAGRMRYDRARHANHWFQLAEHAKDYREIWRYMQLGIAAADRRSLINDDVLLIAEGRQMGGDVQQRLGNAANKASEDARKFLLGMRKPSPLMASLLIG
ncbi:hypothetical protein GCM10023115_05780 [Pontixanthobacter gangjinensis]|uniref:NACHT domain-containing protein n=1 Tax=Pontixanthobacter gangjinensis TaxID=1028742 RepID=A0A6I4SLY5_9SPHN|nr:hypothetical protein [Pontixanthobacter gangjinensis]MXO55827.1 hypothetical protein [Pontixanthobacter gangjinensis]